MEAHKIAEVKFWEVLNFGLLETFREKEAYSPLTGGVT